MYEEKSQNKESIAVAHSMVQKKENGQGLTMVDNRAGVVGQRKMSELINNPTSQAIQKRENNTGLPDNLKSGIENLSGYSMDDVKVHYNSSKPAQLQAHAYAQGTDIHLGSGQEKHLPHEAWHVVQQKQGRVKPTMQMKGKVNINNNAGLEKEADVMGGKTMSFTQAKEQAGNIQLQEIEALNSISSQANLPKRSVSQLKKNNIGQTVIQRVKTIILGESHSLSKITIKRKGKIFSTNPGKEWTKQSEPSKLAAAIIQHNKFTPPSNYQTELENQMEQNGGLKDLMETAESISNGNNPKWGAEDNIIGDGSSAQVGGKVAPKDMRTHIESPQIRADASFIRTMSSIGGHSILKNKVENCFPNKSGYQVLQTIDGKKLAAAESELSGVSATIKSKWTSLKEANGLLGTVILQTPEIKVSNESGVINTVVPATTKSVWADKTIANIEKGLQELLETVVNEINNILGDEFNNPLKAGNQRNQLIKDIAVAKYGSAASVLSRMHGVASIARTLTQLGGMSKTNESYAIKNPTDKNPTTGYIVGDSHLTDLNEIKKVHTNNDKLKAVIDNAIIVRQSEYGDLKKSAKEAVTATKRSSTLKIT